MLDDTDRRFIGVLMFLGSIAVLASFQETWGTVCGIVLWIVSLLYMAQARPQREESYEAYGKQSTPLEQPYRSNLTRNKRRQSQGPTGPAERDLHGDRLVVARGRGFRAGGTPPRDLERRPADRMDGADLAMEPASAPGCE